MLRGMDDEFRPPTLLGLPSYLAGAAARVGHRLLVEALATHDLRLPHFAVLTALSDFGPLPQHELADRLAINRSHLVGYLDDIEQRDLVRRERDPQDRRRQLVALTASGRAQMRRLHEVALRSQAEFLHALTQPEQETLVALLRRVINANDKDRLA
ncbi:MarR family transcriptional regulator [Virgisporangium aurantiacum]|uniref:MarR family transcriptional regulator n=2 Tax=Virgisporangium aurantiacum TaxID=175570 RepID=A0A8J3ZGY8_9ACTN|nr:MarR family transcriptional regulator [Virgisporangium aurantiacum]